MFSWVNRVAANGQQLIDEGHENADQFRQLIDELRGKWDDLHGAIEARKQRLAESEKAHQYLYDCNEAEAWMSEQVRIKDHLIAIHILKE
jgi:spectrin beta